MRVGSATHVGLLRDGNEDALLAAPDRHLFVVADGLGGHPAGEIASAIAITRIDESFDANRNGGDPGAMIADSLRAADDAIAADAHESPPHRGMGTTAVVAYVSDQETDAWLGHVGDSRAYLFREGSLERLTEDHTTGGANERGSITQALGTGPVDPDVSEIEVATGDRLILCSDGLTDMVPDETLESILAEDDEAQETCDRLVAAALAGGGVDNITVVVIDIEGDPNSDTEDDEER